jgi:hypothetical protein
VSLTEHLSPPDPAAAPESTNQLVVALAIVMALTVLGIGLLVAGYVSKQWAIIIGPIGVVLGSLASALNAPSGIGKVLTAAKQVPQNPLDPKEP